VGDPAGDGWRGWARLLADSVAYSHGLSFCNLAVTGATAADVRRTQLREALAHRASVASLVVGLNDTMRSTWDPAQVHDDLVHTARSLADQGALLLTARFHDHSKVFRLPSRLARPMSRRIEAVNAAYDEIHATYGGLRVDLAEMPEIYDRSFWSVDRLHPSELGHRMLAIWFAELLNQSGLSFGLPSPFCTGEATSRLRDAGWLVTQGGPWLGRRAADLAPWLARRAVTEARNRTGFFRSTVDREDAHLRRAGPAGEHDE
jgi:lysophospholipase L1-like esterase